MALYAALLTRYHDGGWRQRTEDVAQITVLGVFPSESTADALAQRTHEGIGQRANTTDFEWQYAPSMVAWRGRLDVSTRYVAAEWDRCDACDDAAEFWATRGPGAGFYCRAHYEEIEHSLPAGSVRYAVPSNI